MQQGVVAMALSDVLSETVSEMEWYLGQPSFHNDRPATEAVLEALRRLLWVFELPQNHPDFDFIKDCVRLQTERLSIVPKLD